MSTLDDTIDFKTLFNDLGFGANFNLSRPNMQYGTKDAAADNAMWELAATLVPPGREESFARLCQIAGRPVVGHVSTSSDDDVRATAVDDDVVDGDVFSPGDGAQSDVGAVGAADDVVQSAASEAGGKGPIATVFGAVTPAMAPERYILDVVDTSGDQEHHIGKGDVSRLAVDTDLLNRVVEKVESLVTGTYGGSPDRGIPANMVITCLLLNFLNVPVAELRMSEPMKRVMAATRGNTRAGVELSLNDVGTRVQRLETLVKGLSRMERDSMRTEMINRQLLLMLFGERINIWQPGSEIDKLPVVTDNLTRVYNRVDDEVRRADRRARDGAGRMRP